MKLKSVSAILCLAIGCAVLPAQASSVQLSEGFDGGGVPAGWLSANFSPVPAGQGWFKPIPSADVFSAAAGAPDSYLATNVYVGRTDANDNPTGRIDAMLATPTLSFEDVTVLQFSTRTADFNQFGDSLKVGALISGSFVDLMTINPSFAVGAYPDAWTTFQVTLPGQGEGVTGRFFFEYEVPDASVAGNFIGIDSVSVSGVPEQSSTLMMLIGGLLVAGRLRRQAKRPQAFAHPA